MTQRDSLPDQSGVIREALGYLSMTQCPYFDHEGTCDRGCYSEPACVVDQPTEGWVGAAIALLDSLASDDKEAS